MRATRTVRRALLSLSLYLAFCAVAGILVADGTLHPARRAITAQAKAEMQEIVAQLDSALQDVSLRTTDAVTLRAWRLRPRRPNGDAVILLHGLGDNRMGMNGYAQLLLAHGYTVLLPDARAHGESGGALATHGLLERKDIHEWFDWLSAQEQPHCIYAFGESMGAAQVLQSLTAGVHFCGVVAESSFSSFREIAYDRMGQPFHVGPWFGRTVLRPLIEVALLRVRWKYNLNMQEVSPEDAVAGSSVPVLLIHGEIDSNIPVRHSRRIHARSPQTALWEVPGADHCGAISIAPEEFGRRLLGFLSSHTTTVAAGNQQPETEN